MYHVLSLKQNKVQHELFAQDLWANQTYVYKREASYYFAFLNLNVRL